MISLADFVEGLPVKHGQSSRAAYQLSKTDPAAAYQLSTVCLADVLSSTDSLSSAKQELSSAKQNGSLGGAARRDRLTPERRREIARMGAAARYKKTKKHLIGFAQLDFQHE